MIIPAHIKAIIFDYDGVLGDSTTFNTYACKQAALRCGIDLEDHVYKQCAPGGATIHDIATCIVTHYGKPNLVEQYITYKKSFDDDYVKEVEIFPVVTNVVSRLAQNYPLGINTGTRHILVDSFLKKYDLTSHFQCVVAAEDITHGKPDPESYLLASKLISFPPKDCLVIEDGVSGVVSAVNAGCYVVGLASIDTEKKLCIAGCNEIVYSLDEIMVPTSR